MPDYDPIAEQRRLAAERDAAVAETLAQLDAPGRRRLHAALDVARQVVFLQEDHNFYLDQRCGLLPRRLILAAGRRLVAKRALAADDDVFYLRADELRSALLGEMADPQTL